MLQLVAKYLPGTVSFYILMVEGCLVKRFSLTNPLGKAPKHLVHCCFNASRLLQIAVILCFFCFLNILCWSVFDDNTLMMSCFCFWFKPISLTLVLFSQHVISLSNKILCFDLSKKLINLLFRALEYRHVEVLMWWKVTKSILMF